MTAIIKAVLLDIDGTLVDSNDAHAMAWVETLREFGHQAAFDRVRKLIGKGGDKVLPELTGIKQDTTQGKRISERRSEIFKQKYLPRLSAFPDSRSLLERMHAQGLRLVVATSAREDEMSELIKLAGADGLLYESTSSSEAQNSKPDADIIHAALAKAGVSPDQTVMIGDTPYDIEAATKGGVRTIAFRCGGWDDAALKNAIAIYDGPGDLLHHYDGSPLAQISDD